MKKFISLFLLLLLPLAISQALNNDIIAISYSIVIPFVFICKLWLLKVSDVPSKRYKLIVLSLMLSVICAWSLVIHTHWHSVELYYYLEFPSLVIAAVGYFGSILLCIVFYRNGWCLTLFKPNSKLTFSYDPHERKMVLHFSGTKKNFRPAFKSIKLLLNHVLTNENVYVIELKSPILSNDKFRKRVDECIDCANNLSGERFFIVKQCAPYSPRRIVRLGYWLTFTQKDFKNTLKFWRLSKKTWEKLNIIKQNR
ncbi:hypothetical protein [Shewanella frigidimarina]|uniref:hypothetical protein n=1 Tax=Shewanella frigidimarina TaxID=56812 RepID=UPI003D7ABCE8